MDKSNFRKCVHGAIPLGSRKVAAEGAGVLEAVDKDIGHRCMQHPSRETLNRAVQGFGEIWRFRVKQVLDRRLCCCNCAKLQRRFIFARLAHNDPAEDLLSCTGFVATLRVTFDDFPRTCSQPDRHGTDRASKTKNPAGSRLYGVFFYYTNCFADYLLVPKRGLEPPHLAAHGPEPCASTNSATWANRYS